MESNLLHLVESQIRLKLEAVYTDEDTGSEYGISAGDLAKLGTLALSIEKFRYDTQDNTKDGKLDVMAFPALPPVTVDIDSPQ